MFIRETKKRINTDKKEYDYVQHRLIESIRTKLGPRQKVILNLGTLDIPKDKFKTLANMIEGFVHNNTQQSLFDEDLELLALARHFAEIIIRKKTQTPDNKEPDNNDSNIDNENTDEDDNIEKCFETIDVNSLTTSQGKTIGAEHIALSQLKELSFFNILKNYGWKEKHIKYAAAQICARLVHPASERETARWLRQNSALDELLGDDFSRISDHTLHKTADALLKNKTKIEEELAKKTQDLFSLKETIILYDLTNTYFESSKKHSKIARFGRSKEKRNDCPLVTLALIVDAQGFPKKSKIFEGNVSEPTTLWDIIGDLTYNQKILEPRTVVIDAGIATEANLQKLREDKRFEYVAISRKKNLSKNLFAKSTTKECKLSKNKILSVKKAKVGDEIFLLCQSPDKVAKDEDIFKQRKKRFEKALNSLKNGLKKPHTQKKYSHICERVGRLKERYRIGSLYKIDVKQKDGKATDISFSFNKSKTIDPGNYLIRTSRNDLGEQDLSLVHRTLTMIESAFRWLKSDLGMQPNYHQLDKRVESHMFISVLAYFVLAPILKKLDWGGKFIGSRAKLRDRDDKDWNIPYGWRSVVRIMQTQERVTTSAKCKDGHRLDIRTTMEPTEEQRQIYARLKMKSRPLSRVFFKHGSGKTSPLNHQKM